MIFRRVMKNFDDIWLLLAPKVEYANRKRVCYELWNSLSPEVQQTIYETIADKKTKGLFVDYNPYFALIKNGASNRPKETLTFQQYYERYGTTEAKDGWRMENPTGEQVVYVKG